MSTSTPPVLRKARRNGSHYRSVQSALPGAPPKRKADPRFNVNRRIKLGRICGVRIMRPFFYFFPFFDGPLLGKSGRTEPDQIFFLLGRCPVLDDFINLLNVDVVSAQSSFNGRQPFGQRTIQGHQLTQTNKGPHDHDVDLGRLSTSQDARQHGHPLLRKRIRRGSPQTTPT